MVGTERFLLDHQPSLGKNFAVCKAALLFSKTSKVAQHERDFRMVGTERFLLDRQRSLVQRLGVGDAAFVGIEEG